jgi:hypothetical protein
VLSHQKTIYPHDLAYVNHPAYTNCQEAATSRLLKDWREEYGRESVRRNGDAENLRQSINEQ